MKLNLSENRRFLQNEDGTPFFYLADTAWELFHRLKLEEIEYYFDTRKSQGFNVFQAVLISEMDGLRTPNEYGQVPLNGMSPEKPDQEYFDFVEQVLKLAEEREMYIALVPTWGDKVDRVFGIGTEIFNEINAFEYGKWLGKRFCNNQNIIWMNGGDRSGGGNNFAIWDALGKGIKSEDSNHLMTFHPLGDASSSIWFHNSEWLDFNACQSGHSMRNYPNFMMISYDYLRYPVKPCLDSEPRYEEHAVNWKPEQNRVFNDYDVRQAAYWAVFAGACGHTYGTHPVWQMYDFGREPIGFVRYTWKDALLFKGASQLIHLKNLMLSHSYFDRVPDQSILNAPKVGEEHIRCTLGNDFLMCYLPSGGEVELNTARIPWQASKASWFNPRTGESEIIGTFEKIECGIFTASSMEPENDWVLVLEVEKGNRKPKTEVRRPESGKKTFLFSFSSIIKKLKHYKKLNMKLLIIGGTGNISTPITKMMQGNGHDITLFNYDQIRPEWLLSEVKVIVGNRTDLPQFEKQLFESGNYDCVVDMICFEPEDAAKDIALFKGRTKQFIFCSTVDVYPKTGSAFPVDETFEIGASPTFPYAWKKVECEKLLWEAHKNGDFQLTVIRPAATFNESWSPGVHSFGGQTYHLDRLLKGKPFILHGDGTSVWTAAYRDVTASAFVGAIGNEKAFGQAYNVNGDEMFNIKQMWLTIAKVMNAPEPDFVYIPTHILSKMAPVESEWCVENFMHNNIFNNSKSKRDLGFKQTIRFEEGVKMCINYLTENKLIENSDDYPFYDRIVQEWRVLEAEIENKFKS